MSCVTGIPDQEDTTLAISSVVTSLISLPEEFFHFSFSSSSRVCSSFSLSLILAACSKSWLLTAEDFSCCRRLISCSILLRFGGAVNALSLTREAASSIRSIALSGKNLSAIYLTLILTAVSIDSSEILTL